VEHAVGYNPGYGGGSVYNNGVLQEKEHGGDCTQSERDRRCVFMDMLNSCYCPATETEAGRAVRVEHAVGYNPGYGGGSVYNNGVLQEKEHGGDCTQSERDRRCVFMNMLNSCYCPATEREVGYTEVNCDTPMDSHCSACSYWDVCSAKVGENTLWGRCMDDGTCTQNWGHHRVQYHP